LVVKKFNTELLTAQMQKYIGC